MIHFKRNLHYLSIFLLLLIVLPSCKPELHEKVVDEYPNGIPTKVEYYKWIGDREELVKHIRYYSNGEKQEEGFYTKGEKSGKWTYWYENGNKWSEGYFENGERNGPGTVWYEGGAIQYTGNYNQGKADGEWIFYDGEGNEIKRATYENGKLK